MFQPMSEQFLLIRNLVPRSRIDEVKGEILPSASTTRDLGTKLVDSLSVEIYIFRLIFKPRFRSCIALAILVSNQNCFCVKGKHKMK